MHPPDIFYLGFLLFCIIRGIFRGATKEGFTIAGVFCGFYLASVFYPYPAAIVMRIWGRETAFNLIGFFSIFLSILFLFSIGGIIAAYFLHGKVTFTGHRIFGGGLGLVKGLLIASVVIIALIGFVPKRSVAIKNSMLLSAEGMLSEEIVRIAPEDMERLFRRNLEKMNTLKP